MGNLGVPLVLICVLFFTFALESNYEYELGFNLNYKLPEKIFIIAILGRKVLKNEGKHRHYLNSLEKSSPAQLL